MLPKRITVVEAKVDVAKVPNCVKLSKMMVGVAKCVTVVENEGGLNCHDV